MGIAALVRISELAPSKERANAFRSSPAADWAGACDVDCANTTAAGANAASAKFLRVIFILNIIGLWLAGQRFVFEGFQRSLLHYLPRGIFIGPDLELPHCLLDEHFEARHRL